MAGHYPVECSHTNDLKSLIKSLYPIKTKKELIRLGSGADGGYLLPNDLGGIEVAFSTGL